MKKLKTTGIVFCKAFFLALILLRIPLSASGQESQPTCYVRDKFSYECTYNLTTGYSEKLRHHIVEIEFMDLFSGVHNVTAVLATQEKLKFVRSLCSTLSPPTNSSENGEISVTAMIDGDWCELEIGLNETKSFADPASLVSLPIGQNMHMLDENGRLRFAFWLNTSEFVDYCSFRFSPQGDVKIEHLEACTELQVGDLHYLHSGEAMFYLSNVSRGNNQIIFIASVNNLRGAINVEVTTTQHGLSIPIKCYLDGHPVIASGSKVNSYFIDSLEFSLAEEPFYYYMDESSYCLNFTAPRDFSLRVDAKSREEIEYLVFDIAPQNFSVTQTTFMDQPCYLFTFSANYSIECCLGLRLKDKGWFISPKDMTLADIPVSIKERYLNASSSRDGEYFETDNQFVQQWARQLVKNETNPYIIASLIYDNVTETLSYPQNWRDLLEMHAFNESVSQILRDKIGVCRHFARAYVALCICSGLPARTIVGTAFSFLNETWKKNHEWTEIYLPSCGWVTIDPTWEHFCRLSDKHAQQTYWNYFEDTLNVSSADGAFRTNAKANSQHLLMQLIQQCRDLISRDSPEIEQAEVLLDKATALAMIGSTHDALLTIAQARLLLVIDNSPKQFSAKSELTCIIILGLTILIIALILRFRNLDPYLLKKEEDLHAFSPGEIENRKIEYNTLNEIINTRERSTVIVGSILSSASFLILTTAFRSDPEARFAAIIGGILLEGIWLCYYQATGRLDDICYDLLRKIEKSLGIEVHRYLERHREKSWLIIARKGVWFIVFIALWIMGLAIFI